MESKGSVILLHDYWNDHLRWRILNYDLVQPKMMCGNFGLWIQVSSTAAKPSAAGRAAFGHFVSKKLFNTALCPKKKNLIVKSLGGKKKNIVSVALGFFPTCFNKTLRKIIIL